MSALIPRSIALAAFAVALGGCATLQTAPATESPPPQSAVPDISRARQLTQTLIERARALDSMRTSAVMEYSGGGRHVKAREEITVKRPANLRVDAMSPFGVALVVVANNSELGIFEPSNNTIYRGRATAETLNRFVQIPLAPGPATNLLLGLAPSGATIPQPESVRVADGHVVASYKSDGGAKLELEFEGDNLVMVRVFNAGGQVDYEVRYSDFRDIGGMTLAHALDADFPNSGTKVKFQYQRPIVNGPVANSMFALSPGSSTKEINLDQPS